MKTSHTVILIVVLILVAGGVYAFTRSAASSVPAIQTSTSTPVMQETSGTAPAATMSGSATVSATPVASAPAGTPAAKHFTVNGNDATADVKTITVAKGTPVSITFGADAGTTYHGGLDFRSASVSTGTIAPGSTKTVSFTASSNMTFTPYWPSTNIAKPYVISVVVTQ